MNNKAMYNLSYGLFVLTARENEKDNGCIVNTVAQVTTSPNRILVAVNKNNYTHGMILRTGEFNVSILTERAAFNTFKHWGFQSGSDVDKAVGITFKRAENQIIYLTEETNAYISAKVISTTDLGTHTLFLADVTDAEILSDDPSVTYSYYRRRLQKKAISVPYVVISTKESHYRKISFARSANIRHPISNRCNNKTIVFIKENRL